MRKSKTIVWLAAVAVFMGASCSHAQGFFKSRNDASGDYAKVGVALPDGERLVASESLECDRSSANRESISDDPEQTNCVACWELKKGKKGGPFACPKAAGKVIQAVEALHEGCVGSDRRIKPAGIKTISVVCEGCDLQSRK